MSSNLILPESYLRETHANITAQFKKSLEKVINENQNKTDPYFVTYHDNDDKVLPGVIRSKWQVHDHLPQFWARQICYIVDNSKGFKEWLWTIDDDRQPHMNVEGVRKAVKNGAIKLRNREAAAVL